MYYASKAFLYSENKIKKQAASLAVSTAPIILFLNILCN
jgi:hypothetical protein